MRTYSHALLTLAAVRRAEQRVSVPATLGAVFPDLPVATGAVWLWTKRGQFTRDQLRGEACAKRAFAIPDAALHSAVLVATALILHTLSTFGRQGFHRTPLAFLLGWAGHVATDALTHAEDARPLLWPVSDWRFRSPVSYWEAGRGGRLFALAEPAAVLAVLVSLLARKRRRGARDR